jgi:hypothetical protein
MVGLSDLPKHPSILSHSLHIVRGHCRTKSSMHKGAYPKSLPSAEHSRDNFRNGFLMSYKKKIPALCHAQTVLYYFYFSLLLSLERLRGDNLMESRLRVTPWAVHATRSAAGFPPINYRQNYKRRSPSPTPNPSRQGSQ